MPTGVFKDIIIPIQHIMNLKMIHQHKQAQIEYGVN